MKSVFIKRFILTNLTIILFLGVIQVTAQTPQTIKTSSNDKKAIEDIVRNYLLENPSIIREALQALQVKEAKEKQEIAAKNLKAFEKQIFADPNSPSAGNEKAVVSIVAFFDYNCGYCKSSLPMLEALLATDPKIRVVYKEYPILSQSSRLAAKAALAAHRQGKYAEFHKAFTEATDINDELIKNISEKFGINYETLTKDMNDQKTNEYLMSNYALANNLSIEGTPAYIIGSRVVPGAIDLNSMMTIIEEERAKLSKSVNNAEIVAK